MTDKDFITLAYSKSPKVSRRTTFQDELQAVVSARASRTNADRYSFSDDLDDEENNFLKQLGSRRNRAGAFKTGRSKAKINDFDLSDDESKHGAAKKRVSFLKTQRGGSPLESTSLKDAPEKHRPDTITGGPSDHTPSPAASVDRGDSADRSGGDHASLWSTSLSRQTSDVNSPAPKSPLTSPFDDGGDEAVSRTSPPGDSQEERHSVGDQERPNSGSPELRPGPVDAASTDAGVDGAAGRPAPRPRPRARQRPNGPGPRVAESTSAEPQSSQSLHSTSDGSLTHPTPVPPMDGVTPRDQSPPGSEGDGTTSSNSQSLSLPRSEPLTSLTRTTMDSASLDCLYSDDSKEPERNYSTSFEEFQKDLEEQLDPAGHRHSIGNISDPRRPPSSLIRSSGRSKSACSSRVESRYLGSLKLLDHSSAPGQPQLEAGDSLRAAVYQEWLRKKQETSKEREQQKKREYSLKEEKHKTDERDKKENALASFEAWKEKKSETLKAKAREKEAMARKQQKAAADSEEKKQMAKEVFVKWKKGHDELLRKKYRIQKEAENKLKQKKMEKEEERKTCSKYFYSDWSETKKNVIGEKVTIERKKSKKKAEEEKSEKEEKDKMALEMYEKWLTMKERDLRRQKEERRIQAILQDTPPPPWSPPNKTIPHRK
ncbi:unnamed protein product [Gadus morhua 'NCC']